MKIATIPVISESEVYIFENYVEKCFNIQNLESLLFNKLYLELLSQHSSEVISLWGLPSGVRSSIANLWSNLERGDLLIFLNRQEILQVCLLTSKLQSESVASLLWGEYENEVRQYLVTFEGVISPNQQTEDVISKLISKLSISRNEFQVTDFLKISSVLSEGEFNIVSDLINNLSQNEKKDTVPPSTVGANLDISETLNIFEVIAGTRKKGFANQGFNLTGTERKAIELRAISVAINYFENLGAYKIEDVGSYESFDLKVTGEGVELFVEVKGTTTLGESIILTRNEVQLHKDKYPNNALLIVSEISLERGIDPNATGGKLDVISPWKIEDSSLFPLGYEYRR